MSDSSLSINLTAVLEAFIFMGLVVFTSRHVFPRLSRVIQQRAKRISDGMSAAEHAREGLAKGSQEANEHVREARVHAQEILTHAETRAGHILDTAKNEARVMIYREIAEARHRIDTESASASALSKQELPTLTLAAAEKILGRKIDANTHNDILADLSKHF
jgi:F-type H+-transporting ATPase subunit b